MKHLKRIFEMSNKESMIEKMSDMPDVVPENMTKSEIEEIREMFGIGSHPKWDMDSSYEIGDFYSLPNSAVKMIQLQSSNDDYGVIVEVRILKTDDYYFVTEYVTYDPNIETNIEEMEIEDRGIYQCDTMEGLREFFKKIVPEIWYGDQ